MRVHFSGFKGRSQCTFDCPCGAKKRKRSFTTEHTVNPFNKNDDGTPKGWEQVSREAKEAAIRERDQFLTEPLCRKCEDAMAHKDLIALCQRRRASTITGKEGRSDG